LNLNNLVAYFSQHFNSFFNTDKLTPQEAPLKLIAEEPSPATSPMDIAIIGLAGTYPMSKNIQQLWDNLAKGLDCIIEVPDSRWDYKKYPHTNNGATSYFKYGGFIPDIDKFDPLFFNISPNDAALMDPQERLFMQTTWSTIEDAGYT